MGYRTNDDAPSLNDFNDITIPSPSDGSTIIYHTDGFYDSIREWDIGEVAGTDKALALVNTTPATVGSDQFSPALILGGNAWSTDDTAPRNFKWRIYADGAAAAGDPVSYLNIDKSLNDGSWINQVKLTNLGGLEAIHQIISVGSITALAGVKAGTSGTGSSGYVTFQNVQVAAGSTSPTMINVPTGALAAQQGWLKFWISTTAFVIPYWEAS